MNKDFNSQVEILEWLLQGKEVRCKANQTETYKIIDDQIKYLRYNKVHSYAASTFYNFQQFEKVLNWYENIPEQGVLCKCWDDNEDDYFINIIYKYDPSDDSLNFESKDGKFMNAVPLTKKEVLELAYLEN